jgi:hypothetical protein
MDVVGAIVQNGVVKLETNVLRDRRLRLVELRRSRESGIIFRITAILWLLFLRVRPTR